jgi:hypothetical protein
VRAFLGVIILALSGCVSTQAVNERLSNKYMGKNFDEFVIKHGSPRQTFKLSNGDIAYTWNSGTTKYQTPATATTTSTGNTATTQISGGSSIDMFCEAQFITGADGIVKSVNILKDTTGFWTTSMCHEIFDK